MCNIVIQVDTGEKFLSRLYLWKINSTLDWSSLKWTNELERIWNLSLTQQSFVFDTIDEHWIKTILSWIVVTRIIVAHVYTLTYITNIYPILTWSRPNLLLPWMLLSFFKNVLIELIVLAIAVLLWHEERFSIFLLLEFILVKLVSLVLAVYNWHSNSRLYSRLRRLEKLRELHRRLKDSSYTSEDSSMTRTNGSFVSTRQRTRSLTTLLSAGSQETNDSRDSVSRIFEDPHLTIVEKSMKILGITEADVETARALRRGDATFRKVYSNILEEHVRRIEETEIKSELNVSDEKAVEIETAINREKTDVVNVDSLEELVEDISTKERDEKRAEELITEKITTQMETLKTEENNVKGSRKKRVGYGLDDSKRRKQMKICLPHEEKISRPCFPLVQKRERKFCQAVKSARNLKVLKEEEEEEEREEVGTSKSSTTKKQENEGKNEDLSSAVIKRSEENTFRSCECTSKENFPKEEREEILATKSSRPDRNETNVFRVENLPCDFNLKSEFPLGERVFNEQLSEDVSKSKAENENAKSTEEDCLIMELLELPKNLMEETSGSTKFEDSSKIKYGLHSSNDESMKSLVISTKRKPVSESAANAAGNVVSYILDVESDDAKGNLSEYSFGDTAIPKLLKNSIKIFDGCYEKGFVENSELRCLLRQMEKKNWNVFSGQISTAEDVVLKSDQIHFYDKRRVNPIDLPNSDADKTDDESQKVGRTTPRRTQLVSQGTQAEVEVQVPPSASNSSVSSSKNAHTQTLRGPISRKPEQKSASGGSKTKFFSAGHRAQNVKTANKSPTNSVVHKVKDEKSLSTLSKESVRSEIRKHNCQVLSHTKETADPQRRGRSSCACRTRSSESQKPIKGNGRVLADRKNGKSNLENFATLSLPQTARVSGFERAVPGKPPVYPKKNRSRAEGLQKLPKPAEIEAKRPMEKKSTCEAEIEKLKNDFEEERQAREMRTLRAYNELTLHEDRRELEAKRRSPVSSKKAQSFKGLFARRRRILERRKGSDDSCDVEISYDDYLDKENIFDGIATLRDQETLRNRSKENVAEELPSNKRSNSKISRNGRVSQSDSSNENKGSDFWSDESSEIILRKKTKGTDDAVDKSLPMNEQISPSSKPENSPTSSTEKSFDKNPEVLQNTESLESAAAKSPREKYPTTRLRTEKVVAVLLEHFDRLHGGQAKEVFRRSQKSFGEGRKLQDEMNGREGCELEGLVPRENVREISLENAREISLENVREISLEFGTVSQNRAEASDESVIECFVRQDTNEADDGAEEDDGRTFSVVTRRVAKPRVETDLCGTAGNAVDYEDLIFRRIKMIEELEVEGNPVGNADGMKDYGEVTRKIIEAIEILKSEPDLRSSKNVETVEGPGEMVNILQNESENLNATEDLEDHVNMVPGNDSSNVAENAKRNSRESRGATFLTASFLENQENKSTHSPDAANFTKILQLSEDPNKDTNQSITENDFSTENRTQGITCEINEDLITETAIRLKNQTAQLAPNTSDFQQPPTSPETASNSTTTTQQSTETNNSQHLDTPTLIETNVDPPNLTIERTASPAVRPRTLPLNLHEITRNIVWTSRPRGVVLTNKSLRVGVHGEGSGLQESQQRDIVEDSTASLLHRAFLHRPEIVTRSFHRSSSAGVDSGSEFRDAGGTLRESLLESVSDDFVCRVENEGEILQGGFPSEYGEAEGSQGLLTTAGESSRLGSCDLCVITIGQDETANSEENESDGNSQLDAEEVDALSDFIEILRNFRFRGLDLRRISSIEPEALRELASAGEFSEAKTPGLIAEGDEESVSKENGERVDANSEASPIFLSNVDKSDLTATVLTSLTDNPGPSGKKPVTDFPERLNDISVLIDSNGRGTKENVTDTAEKIALLSIAAELLDEKLNGNDKTNDGAEVQEKRPQDLWTEDIVVETIEDHEERDSVKGGTDENCGDESCCVGEKPRRPEVRKSPFATTFEYKLQHHHPRRGRGLSSGYLMDFNSEGTLELSTPKISEESSLASNSKSETFENPLSASEIFPISDSNFRVGSPWPIETCWSSSARDDLNGRSPSSRNEEEIEVKDLRDVGAKGLSEKTEKEDAEAEEHRVSLRIILTFWLIVFLFYVRSFYQMLRSISRASKSTCTSRPFEVHTVSTSTSRLLEQGVLGDSQDNDTQRHAEGMHTESAEQRDRTWIPSRETEEDSERLFIEQVAPNELTSDDFGIFSQIEEIENPECVVESLSETALKDVEVSATSTSGGPEELLSDDTLDHSTAEMKQKKVHFENAEDLLNNTFSVAGDANVVTRSEGVIKTVGVPSTSKSADRLSDNESLDPSSPELPEKEIHVETLELSGSCNESLKGDNEEASNASLVSMRSNSEDSLKLTEPPSKEIPDEVGFIEKLARDSSPIKNKELEKTVESPKPAESNEAEGDLKNTGNGNEETRTEIADRFPPENSAFQSSDSFNSSFENADRSENADSFEEGSTMEEFFADNSVNSSRDTLKEEEEEEEAYESCS